MADLIPIPVPGPGGLPLPVPLPPGPTPAQSRAAAEALGRGFANAGERLSSIGGQIADGEVSGALRDLFVPGVLSGHQWPDTLLPETPPQPGPDGIAAGRMQGMPQIAFELDTARRQLSLFGVGEFGQATTGVLNLQAGADGAFRGPSGAPLGLLHADGSFELLRRPLGEMADTLRRQSPTYPRGGTRTAVSPQAASTPPDPDWDPGEVPRRNPDAADRLYNAMRSYRTSEYQVGRWTVRLDRSGMNHIMERHTPETWNGTTRMNQTFLARDATPVDIQRMVGEVIRQNRDFLLQNMTTADADIVGRAANGANIRVIIANGRVVTAFPVR